MNVGYANFFRMSRKSKIKYTIYSAIWFFFYIDRRIRLQRLISRRGLWALPHTIVCTYFVIKIDTWNENYFFGVACHLMHVLKTFKSDRDKCMIAVGKGTAPLTTTHPSFPTAQSRLAGSISGPARSCLWINTFSRRTVAASSMLLSMFSGYQQ